MFTHTRTTIYFLFFLLKSISGESAGPSSFSPVDPFLSPYNSIGNGCKSLISGQNYYRDKMMVACENDDDLVLRLSQPVIILLHY